jgi:putative phosphoribosyl transferase
MHVHDLMIKLPFRSRIEAGRLLGAELSSRRIEPDPIVLALPGGGVAVAAEVAAALNAPLDVLAARKLGVPRQPELTMGAIANGISVLDEALVRELRISEEEIAATIARETHEAERSEKLYRGHRCRPDLRARAVVIVDDGLASGWLMVAAARATYRACPRQLIIAIPVASSQACKQLAEEADSCICLAVPASFRRVGDCYIDFPRLDDGAVQELLARTAMTASCAVR